MRALKVPTEIRDVETGELLHTFTHGGAVLSALFGPGSETVITGSADRTVRVWAASTGKELKKVTFTPD